MIIDLSAYLAGLMMPLAYFLGFLASLWPSLHFSFSEYLLENDYHPKRTYFWPSFVIGAVTSISLMIWGVVMAITKMFEVFGLY